MPSHHDHELLEYQQTPAHGCHPYVAFRGPATILCPDHIPWTKGWAGTSPGVQVSFKWMLLFDLSSDRFKLFSCRISAPLRGYQKQDKDACPIGTWLSWGMTSGESC